MKKLARMLVIAAMVALAAGCGKQPKPSTRLTIAVIPKDTMHEFWKTVHAGAVKASRELDVDIIWKGPIKEDDRDAQIAVVEDFISKGVSGMALAPLDGGLHVMGKTAEILSSENLTIVYEVPVEVASWRDRVIIVTGGKDA